MKVRTRFAPSPTGFMHIGNLRTALYAYLYAKKENGDFILRIEDTDLERYVEGAVDVIYSTLKQSNIKIDEGPNEGGNYGPYIQSERKALYKDYAVKLVETGHAYYCFCDKERLNSLKNETGIARYDKHCLHLSKEEIENNLKNNVPYVIRQNMPTEGNSEYDDLVYGKIVVPNNELEDQILIKSDGLPTYNFANVVDDHLMGITHVIRGNEYLSSTPKYNYLYDAFGWERPKYIHLTPIMKDETRKLSKRHGDANFDDFINKGFIPEAIINYIALLGWSPKGEKEKFTMDELIASFDINGLSKSPSIFDEVKMRWLNGEYIKEMSLDKFLEYATPYFDKSVIKDKYDYKKFAEILQSRIEVFSEIPSKVEFIANYSKIDNEMYFNKKFKIDSIKAKEVLEYSIPKIEAIKEFNKDTIENVINEIIAELAVKGGVVHNVLRIAVSSVSVTPGGSIEIMDILGYDESISRLKQALAWLNE